jgi:hypothetical protein
MRFANGPNSGRDALLKVHLNIRRSQQVRRTFQVQCTSGRIAIFKWTLKIAKMQRGRDAKTRPK